MQRMTPRADPLCIRNDESEPKGLNLPVVTEYVKMPLRLQSSAQPDLTCALPWLGWMEGHNQHTCLHERIYLRALDVIMRCAHGVTDHAPAFHAA